MTDAETVSRVRLIVNNDRLEKIPHHAGYIERAVFLGALVGIVAAVLTIGWLLTTMTFSLPLL